MPMNNNYQTIVFKRIYYKRERATVSLLYSWADWAIKLLDGQKQNATPIVPQMAAAVKLAWAEKHMDAAVLNGWQVYHSMRI